jgi:hypothetical protein
MIVYVYKRMENRPHIAFGFDCSLGRVYYQDNEFVCITMCRASYVPFFTTKIANMVAYLLEIFEKTTGEIDWKLNYPNNFSKRKKQKIRYLLEHTNCDETILSKWLTLLFI